MFVNAKIEWSVEEDPILNGLVHHGYAFLEEDEYAFLIFHGYLTEKLKMQVYKNDRFMVSVRFDSLECAKKYANEYLDQRFDEEGGKGHVL